MGRIGLRCQDEKNLVVLMVEFAQRYQVAFQSRFHSFTRTEDSRAGSIEAGVDLQPLLDICEPQNALPEQIDTRSNLQDRQDIKKGFHVLAE